MRYSEYTIVDAWKKHENCEMVIYHKKFSNGDLVPGLYCKQYGLWIQWLDIKTADDLVLSGVEVVLTQPEKLKGHPIKRMTADEWFSKAELGI
jgi:hypothetical protein